MSKRKVKAITALKQANIYINELDDAIEKETYNNADVIFENLEKENYLRECHKKILEVLDIKSTNDSKYFNFDVYEEMVMKKIELRQERKRKAEERKKKADDVDIDINPNADISFQN